jgi:hypothetical protein
MPTSSYPPVAERPIEVTRRAMRLQGKMAAYKGLAELDQITEAYDVVADPESGDVVVILDTGSFNELKDRLATHDLVKGQGWNEVTLVPMNRLEPEDQSRLRNWKHAS